MHPTQQLKRDTLILSGTILCSIVFVYMIMSNHAGYTPHDECANDVRSALSPYQVQQLIESEQLPPQYRIVRQWCETHPAYRPLINDAKSWPMFPAQTDMITY